MMKKGEKKMKKLFKPAITNKNLEIRYKDSHVRIGKYLPHDITWVYTFDKYEGRWTAHGALDFDFESDSWWYGSHSFKSYEEIAKYWNENMILHSREMSDKEFEDSILNGYICEMSEGMMSLSHVG